MAEGDAAQQASEKGKRGGHYGLKKQAEKCGKWRSKPAIVVEK